MIQLLRPFREVVPLVRDQTKDGTYTGQLSKQAYDGVLLTSVFHTLHVEGGERHVLTRRQISSSGIQVSYITTQSGNPCSGSEIRLDISALSSSHEYELDVSYMYMYAPYRDLRKHKLHPHVESISLDDGPLSAATRVHVDLISVRLDGSNENICTREAPDLGYITIKPNMNHSLSFNLTPQIDDNWIHMKLSRSNGGLLEVTASMDNKDVSGGVIKYELQFE